MNLKFVLPAILSSVVIIAGIFAFLPVEKASTVHGTFASSSDVANQDQIVSFSFTTTAASEEFITSADENGWVGRITLFACDGTGGAETVSIDVDRNNDGDATDAGETDVVSVTVNNACDSAEAALPDGTDRILLDLDNALDGVTVILHLDTNPEL